MRALLAAAVLLLVGLLGASSSQASPWAPHVHSYRYPWVYIYPRVYYMPRAYDHCCRTYLYYPRTCCHPHYAYAGALEHGRVHRRAKRRRLK